MIVLSPRPAVRAVAIATVLCAGVALLAGCVPEPGSPSASSAPTSSTSASPSTPPTPTLPATVPPAPPSPTAEPDVPASGVGVSIITADVVDRGVEVSGIVVGEVESSGVCTLVASSAGTEATAEAPATPSGDNSYCPVLSVGDGQLAPGTWTVHLEYRSDTVSGRSSSMTVEVP